MSFHPTYDSTIGGGDLPGERGFMRMFRLPAILVLAWFSGSGCVAYQIRDELRTTNQRLEKMSNQLDKMSAELAQVNVSLAQTNQKMDRSNHSLAVMENSMDPIRVSLRRIDDELAGFREMIDKIDRYIPVNIKADTPPPSKQAPTHETTPAKQ
jgi:septal ring factor EnvC (AmiA/AmiB activator)